MYFTVFRSTFAVVAITLLISFMYSRITVKKIPCANTISCKTPPRFEVEKNAIGIYNNRPIHVPNISLRDNENTSPVLGITTSHGEKHIYVNLTTETLTAYDGSTVFMETPISSGLWGKTPTGDFTIWSKYRSIRMTGGSGADYYDLPNVPYVMFFSNNEVPTSAGFSIHGTYWHNNFGHAMSHGCVNMKTTDVAKLYEWADGPNGGNKGTAVTIY